MAASPGPPNAPKSFCAPCATKMTPTTSRSTSSGIPTDGRAGNWLVAVVMVHLALFEVVQNRGSSDSVSNFGTKARHLTASDARELAALGRDSAAANSRPFVQ